MFINSDVIEDQILQLVKQMQFFSPQMCMILIKIFNTTTTEIKKKESNKLSVCMILVYDPSV